MSQKPPVEIIFGSATLGNGELANFTTVQAATDLINIFQSYSYNTLDTAQNYTPGAPTTCETLLGKLPQLKEFNIDTKLRPGPGSGTEESVKDSLKGSLERLGVPIRVYYIHVPDGTTPFEITAKAFNDCYLEGSFKEFGISNFSPEQVEALLKICEEKGYVKPTVYQGLYNPISRNVEQGLFPILKKHNIRFIAYSPTAGGFFSGRWNPEDYSNEEGRFKGEHMIANIYRAFYLKPAIYSALQKLLSTLPDFGISNGIEASLRWTAYHSGLEDLHGGLILGFSKQSQLKDDLDYLSKGPLPKEVVNSFEKLWEEVKHETTSPF